MNRVRLIGAVATVAVLLAACSQSVNGTAEPAGGGSSGTRFPTDVAGLGRFLQGNRSLRSAHIALREVVGTTTVAATGVEKLDDGQVQAMDMSETVSGEQVRFIIIGPAVYAKLPATTTIEHTKPWIGLSASTSDPTLQQLYSQFQTSRTEGATFGSDVFAKAARKLKLTGTSRFDGETVARYTMTLDVDALPSDFPNLSQLAQYGLTTLPLQLWVDHEGRTRKLIESLSLMGQHVRVEFALTGVDQPVSIAAPPASEVEQK